LVQNLLSSHLLSKNFKIRIYRTTILPVVLYGCETSSLTLREEHRLRVFANKVLRRMFRPKKDEMAVGCRKLHNDEFHNLQSSPSTIGMSMSRRIKWVGNVACMGLKKDADRILAQKPKGNRPLGRTRCRWEDIIKMDLREIGWGSIDWVDLTKGRVHWMALVNTVMNFWVSYNVEKFLSS
jgi:hypothetical protein